MFRVVKILTDGDGYVCGEARLLTGPVDKYGSRPLFKLRHQELVPLEDVQKLLAYLLKR